MVELNFAIFIRIKKAFQRLTQLIIHYIISIKILIRINWEMKLKNKKSRNIIGIIQSCLIFALVILVIFMMIQINRLQGTARVINYAGLVRGATQREVKLEITGSQNDELIKYLDDILSGLKYQDGNYDLVKLQDKEYQDKLQIQIDYCTDHNGNEDGKAK